MKVFPHLNRKYSGQPNDSLDLLEFITFLNAAEKIIQTNVVGRHKRNWLLIFIYWMENNDWKYAQHISSAGPEVWQENDSWGSKEIKFKKKAPRDKTLAQMECHITFLVHRASTIYNQVIQEKKATARSSGVCLHHHQTWSGNNMKNSVQKSNHAQPLIYKKYYIICIGQLMLNICLYRTGKSRIKSKCPVTNTQRIKQIHILAMV